MANPRNLANIAPNMSGSGGNVGIGTSSPTTVLHTMGANGTSATTLATSYTYAKLRFQNSSGSSLSAYQGTVNSGDTWYTQITNGSGTTPYNMVFNPFGGNVGIGNTSPNVKFDVLSGTANTGGDTITLQTASITGADLAFSNHAGILNVATNTTPTTNVGGSIGFAGAWSGTSQAGYALIKGAKENSSTNYASYLAFYTRPDGAAMSERMRLNSTGSLLVGTSSQLATNLLHTVTKQQLPSSNSTAWADQMSPLVVYGNFGDGSNDQGASSALTVVGWSSLAGNVGAIMRGWWSQSGAGLSTPTLKFQIAHTGNVTNLNNSYGSLSDLRLKENITDATPKLENLNKLRVVNFNLKEDPNKCKQIGLIAQEVEQVFPALVETDGEGTKSVKYSVLVPMLVKAMQEQQTIIESLKARLDAANL